MLKRRMDGWASLSAGGKLRSREVLGSTCYWRFVRAHLSILPEVPEVCFCSRILSRGYAVATRVGSSKQPYNPRQKLPESAAQRV